MSICVGCQYGDHTSVCSKTMCSLKINWAPCCNTCRDEILRDAIKTTAVVDVAMETTSSTRFASSVSSSSTLEPSMTSSAWMARGVLGSALVAWKAITSWLLRRATMAMVDMASTIPPLLRRGGSSTGLTILFLAM